MDKKSLLLEYLKKQEENFISAETLAEYLNVTKRSIRSYVRIINDKYPNTVQSNKSGYKINKKDFEYIDKIKDGSHVNNRRFYILRRLIKSSERGLDIFDLADALYVSEATIRSDVANLNKKIIKGGLRIIQEKERYFLNGEEKDRRKLMTDLIDHSKPTNVSLEEEIQLFLGDIPLQRLKEISNSVFKKFNVKLNTYTFNNFILHLVVTIDRVFKNKQLKQSIDPFNNKGSIKLQIINEIENNLHQLFGIQFSKSDKEALALLFDIRSEDDYSFVNTNIYNAVGHALQEISNIYMVEFGNNDFKRRLTIHIQHLYNRVTQNSHARNLDVLNIRINYPIIFDIAVYLTSVISNDLNIEINEDEIAFIALHIGSYLNNYSDDEEDEYKIKTAIITPSYLSQQNNLRDKIQNHFGDDLIIVDVFDSYNEIASSISFPFELVITTVDLEKLKSNSDYKNTEINKVHEFITKYDLSSIESAIKKVKQNRYFTLLKSELPKLIKEGFVNNSNNSSKFGLMKTVSNIFFQHNHVEDNYLDKLKEREQASSTAFPSEVAIPHPMHYEAKKTGIIILKPKEKTFWDDIEVKLIIGISVSKKEAALFNLIFPRMVEVLSEPHNVDYLTSRNTRDETIHTLIKLMTENGYFPEQLCHIL